MSLLRRYAYRLEHLLRVGSWRESSIFGSIMKFACEQVEEDTAPRGCVLRINRAGSEVSSRVVKLVRLPQRMVIDVM